MIGHVTAYREAVISLNVRDSRNQEQEIEAVVDTGFNGFLTLPTSLIEELDLVWRRRGRAMLADGSNSVFDIYEATVRWNNRPRRIAVDAVECDPLVGMSLLYGYELTVQVVDGGLVSIYPLPWPNWRASRENSKPEMEVKEMGKARFSGAWERQWGV